MPRFDDQEDPRIRDAQDEADGHFDDDHDPDTHADAYERMLDAPWED